MSMPSTLPPAAPISTPAAVLRGLRAAATSVFLFVVSVTYVGFGALVHDFGFSLGWGELSTVLMWAAPAQVILVTALGSGAPLLETAITVGLSSVRLLPMVVALLPLIRGTRTRSWGLVLPAHLIAISMWVEAMRLAPGIARDNRLAFCAGIGFGLLGVAMIATAFGFYLSAVLPAVFAAAAIFITPMSFTISMVRNSRTLFEGLAFGLALIIGPLLAYHAVRLDLLWTGIIAGSLGYLAHRLRRALS
jgi:predicted branched-subunit amino acid permease